MIDTSRRALEFIHSSQESHFQIELSPGFFLARFYGCRDAEVTPPPPTPMMIDESEVERGNKFRLLFCFGFGRRHKT
jgi:hypothetical protein